MAWNLPEPPYGVPWGLYGLCGASLLLNLAFTAAWISEPEPAVVPVVAVASVTDAEPNDLAETPARADAEPEAPAPVAADLADAQVFHASVQHSLARTFQRSDLENPDRVSAVFARHFVWDLDVRSDLQRGDGVGLAYRTQSDGNVDVLAATYTSAKLGKTLSAYQYHVDGESWPSWWDAQGQEVQYRLNDSPLPEYQQITSLLKDRPTHKGLDFKAPVGTPVLSPRAGRVVRVNWNWKYNGNCVEVQYSDGVLARFLHLSENTVEAGETVQAGQLVGKTGNTGRSTAPHLHYELRRGESVVDPIDYHGSYRRSLPDSEVANFQNARAELDQLLTHES